MSRELTTFDCWAIVELMGHVRVAGIVTEEERFGTKMGRVDVPGPDGSFTTQYFGGASVYRVTPCTEEIARAVSLSNQPQPVHLWTLRGLLPEPPARGSYMGPDADDSDDDDPE